jgi:hypothetical protein
MIVPAAHHGGMNSLVIRTATSADDAALVRLAQLDSRSLPAGPHLIAELGGRPVAALARSGGATIADPFTRTADIVALLHERAAQIDRAPRRRRVARLRLAGV